MVLGFGLDSIGYEDDLDEDFTSSCLGMALMNSADLRCTFKRSGKRFGDGDEEVRRIGSEMSPYDCALLFVCRVVQGSLHSSFRHSVY